jgi:hypothetical protein
MGGRVVNYLQRHVLIGCLIFVSTFVFGSWGEDEKTKGINRLEDSSFSYLSPNQMMVLFQEDHSHYKNICNQKMEIDEEGCIQACFLNGETMIIGAPIERLTSGHLQLIDPRSGNRVTLDWNTYTDSVRKKSQEASDALRSHFHPGRALNARLMKDPCFQTDSVVEDVQLEERIENTRAFTANKMAIEAMIKIFESSRSQEELINPAHY